jgi:hypothetical protein
MNLSDEELGLIIEDLEFGVRRFQPTLECALEREVLIEKIRKYKPEKDMTDKKNKARYWVAEKDARGKLKLVSGHRGGSFKKFALEMLGAAQRGDPKGYFVLVQMVLEEVEL